MKALFGSTADDRDEIVARLRKIGAYGTLMRIADEHAVAPRAVVGRSRQKYIVRARHQFWAVLRWTLGMSYPEIAKVFGVDHTTVLYAVQEYEHRINEANP